MKFGRRRFLLFVFLLLAFTLRAELQRWVQQLRSGPLIAVFFRSVPMPGGAVDMRRPPKETIPALTAEIAKNPNGAELYRLRASEEELALDFKAAEVDWRKFAALSKDRASVYGALADYFHRRIQPRDEIAALRTVALTRDVPRLPVQEQQPWWAFERMLTVSEEENLPTAVDEATHRAWIARYPKEQTPRRRYIDYLIAHQEYAAADAQIDAYTKTFPADSVYLIEARANLASARGSKDDGLRVYDSAFEPLWPAELDKAYFAMLEEQGKLREYTGRVRAKLQANPSDLDAASRLFHYYVSRNNQAAARRVLVELRLAKESRKQAWSAAELLTLAELFNRVLDVNETARFYYALYSLPNVSAADAEQALAGLTGLLFNHPGVVRFGTGDLSFYRDIATVDASPGFLNGILSLVLNSTSPQWAYEQQDQTATAYFQRARAAQLLDLFDRRFPKSERRAPLHTRLIQTYATYGDDEAIIKAGRSFLASFPDAGERQTVASLLADAYARQGNTAEEFALYDQLLRELGARAHGSPLGPGSNVSTAYTAVLDRYLARLSDDGKQLDALRVYRREVDRNPNDPTLYERLTAYLQENAIAQDVEAAYRRAIAKFPGTGWYDKLARWYLRQRETAALDKLTREVAAIFSGTELETYVAAITSEAGLDAAMYRQVNLYAHERFPEDLVFVHNLLNAYSRKETLDSAAYDRLLRRYWFYEAPLRNLLFERLSSAGQLDVQLAQVLKQNPDLASDRAQQGAEVNPASAQFVAEAQAWLSHFEAAAPDLRAVAVQFPGSLEASSRATMVYRSLAAYDPANTEVAANLANAVYRTNPRNRDALANIGDIYADRELFARARPYWNRMTRIEPGKPDGYLEAATVFWDYYLYDDALRIIQKARTDFDDPTLYAFQAGVISENRRHFPDAVKQYVAGSLAGEDECRERLLRLAKRESMASLVEKETAAALTSGADRTEAVKLRAAVLQELNRTADLETLLLAELGRSQTATEAGAIGDLAGAEHPRVRTAALERRVVLTADPVDKMRLRIELAKFYEEGKDVANATRTFEQLYRDNPLILGVVRARVDYLIRNKQLNAAAEVLMDAAGRANAGLSSRFKLEAANVAADGGSFGRARAILSGLLQNEPYNAQYQTAMSNTYSKAGDDRGLRQFQLDTIASLAHAPIPAADRAERIAGMRRGLIPALTRLKDYAGAVDQYIEVLNHYPEDESLAREALFYAGAHGRKLQILDFYKKTIEQAPRDYRWPILYGRLQTAAEDYPAAIEAYDLAMKARPDRGDVVKARAEIEERLLRFDDAAKSYARLYDLTYRDQQWMVKIAELRARLGQNDEAVTSLRTAFIGAHAETSEADLTIAGYLDHWNLVPRATQFAESAARLGGGDFGSHVALGEYARVLTRARRVEPVLTLLTATPKQSKHAVEPMGAAVNEFYTPEEKRKFEQLLIARQAGVDDEWTSDLFIPLASAAHLTALECRWRFELMMHPAGTVDQRYVQLESAAGNYEELGKRMEEYAAAPAHVDNAGVALRAALAAYTAAGDSPAQLRVMRVLLSHQQLGEEPLSRYLAELARNHHEDLLAVIRSKEPEVIRDQAVSTAILQGPESFALRAIDVLAAQYPPVWKSSYAALTGLYYADQSPRTAAAFEAALDTRTIGDRLKVRLTNDQRLAGNVWFYYGGRYAEYLDLLKKPAARDFRAASLEATAGNPEAYLALGDYLAGIGDNADARTQFESVLQLDSNRGDAHDHIARMLWKLERRDEALAHWRLALAGFQRVQSAGGRVDEPFWGRVEETFRDIGRAHALAQLRTEVERLLEDYINRNGGYRSDELVQSAFAATLDSGLDLSWLLSTAQRVSGGSGYILNALMQEPELTLKQRIEIQRLRVTLAQRSEFESTNEQLDLVALLLDANEIQTARSEFAHIKQPQSSLEQYWTVQLRLGAAEGLLSRLLEDWRANPGRLVPDTTLTGVATLLRDRGDENSALTILEFMYRRALERGELNAANFMGLAGVLLDRGDSAGAMAQLRRMLLVVSEPFDTLMPASELLSKHGKKSEAIEFAKMRVRAVPWDAGARLRLVNLDPSGDRAGVLNTIANDAQVGYRIRVNAARLVAPQGIRSLAGTELGLLAGSRILPDAAAKPYYVAARVAAAEDTADPVARLNLLRAALQISRSDDDVRLAAVRAALDARRDRFAISLYQAKGDNAEIVADSDDDVRFATARAALHALRDRFAISLYQAKGDKVETVDDPGLRGRLADAAERIGDLKTAVALLSPGNEQRLKSIRAKMSRIAENQDRAPVIGKLPGQARWVRPRIEGGAQ